MGHSTSSGRTAAFSPEAERALNSEGSLVDRLNAYNRAMDEADRRRVTNPRAAFEDEIDRATFSGDGNIKSFQIAGVGAAEVRYGRDEFGNIGWTARVATPNTNVTPINGNRRFKSREAAEARAREALKNRVRAERAEFQRDRERQERIIRANNRILGRNTTDEEVARRATRVAEANAANRRRRGR